MTATITVPGSKSLTNRALLLAALAKGKSTIHNILLSDDTHVMIAALKELGVTIKENGTTLTIMGAGKFQPPHSPLQLENAGTAVRFLTAILAHQPFETTIEGNERMRARPLKDLLEALATLGAHIQCNTGCPPLTIKEGPLTGSNTHLSGQQSSQYVSALLMLGPLLPHGLTLTLDDKLTSKPYVDLTIQLMKEFGILNIQNNQHHSYKVLPQSYFPQTINIEADASSAGYFFGIAALTGKKCMVTHLKRTTLQPDIKVLKALEDMGCTIKEMKEGIFIQGPRVLKPLNFLDANDFPDGAMTLAVIAAFADGPTTLTGLHNLKLKESDRLMALSTELRKIGALVSTTDHSITLHGNRSTLHGATIETYNDHRMAMCFGMAQTVLPNLIIQNPNCVSKTYPDFWKDLKKLSL